MIKIKINGKFLDLTEKLNINLYNPIFDTQGIGRLFSYPTNLPTTSNNLEILKFPTRIDAKGVRQFDNAVMYLFKNQYEIGRFDVESVSENAIKAVFKNKPLAAIEALEKIKVNEALETIEITQTVKAFYTLRIKPNFTAYSFSFNNAPLIWLQGVTPNPDPVDWFVESVNQPNFVFGNAIKLSADTFRLENAGNVKMSVEYSNTIELVERKTLAEARQENMLAFAVQVAQFGHAKISLNMMYNTAFYAENNKQFTGFINYWRQEQKVNIWQDEPAWEQTYIPFLRVKYVLSQIAEKAGFAGIGGEFLTEPDILLLCLYNNYALDYVEKDVYTVTENNETVEKTRYLNGYKSEINLNNHALDWNGKEFIDAFISFFNLYTTVENNTLIFKKKTNQLNENYKDWTKKADPAYSRDFSENLGVTLQFSTETKDAHFEIGQLLSKKIGEGKEVITTKFKPLYDHDLTVVQENNTYTLRLPRIEQKGSSDALGLGKNESGARLFFDRGLKQDTSGTYYSLAQHGATDILLGQTGVLTLDWNAENGIYEANWKGYTELLNKDTIEKIVLLNVIDVLNIRRWENSKIKIKSPEGEFFGVLKSIQFQADPSSEDFVIAAKATFVIAN